MLKISGSYFFRWTQFVYSSRLRVCGSSQPLGM